MDEDPDLWSGLPPSRHMRARAALVASAGADGQDAAAGAPAAAPAPAAPSAVELVLPPSRKADRQPEAALAPVRRRRAVSGPDAAPGASCCACVARPKPADPASSRPHPAPFTAVAAATIQHRESRQRLHDELQRLRIPELEAHCFELGVPSAHLSEARRAEDPAAALTALAIAAEPRFPTTDSPASTGATPRLDSDGRTSSALRLSPVSSSRGKGVSVATSEQAQLSAGREDAVWSGLPSPRQQHAQDGTHTNHQQQQQQQHPRQQEQEQEAVGAAAVRPDELGLEQAWTGGGAVDGGGGDPGGRESVSSNASSDTLEARRLCADSKRLGQTIVLQVRKSIASFPLFCNLKHHHFPNTGSGQTHGKLSKQEWPD